MNIFEVIAFCLSISGIIFTAYYKRIGWIFYSLANTIWLPIAIKNELYLQATLWIIFTIFNVFGYINWTRNPVKKKEKE